MDIRYGFVGAIVDGLWFWTGLRLPIIVPLHARVGVGGRTLPFTLINKASHHGHGFPLMIGKIVESVIKLLYIGLGENL